MPGAVATVVAVMTRGGRTVAGVVAALALAGAACGEDDPAATSARSDDLGRSVGAAASTTSTTPTTGPGSTGSSATTTGASGAGAAACGVATSLPTGPTVGSGPVVDLDGDGRRDQAWVSGGPGQRQVGVALAEGGGDAVAVEVATAGPLSLLVADADATPPVELFVSDGTIAELWVFAGCALQPVIGPDDLPYLFDLGERGNGTGVGCTDVGGSRELVGVNVVADDQDSVSWERTVIDLDGTTATHGATDSGTLSYLDQEPEIGLLHEVTCGELVMSADGIAQPAGVT
jgi:hypothetical protein